MNISTRIQFKEPQVSGLASSARPKATRSAPGGRQRKAHAKSRRGCGNCKLRRVKCDEDRPSCKRCNVSGYACNYDGSIPDLTLQHGSEIRLDLAPTTVSQRLTPPLTPPRIDLPWADPTDRRAPLPFDMAMLHRFRTKTARSIGGSAVATLFVEPCLKLVPSSPYLVHIAFALTLMHDMYLDPQAMTQADRYKLSLHMSQGTLLFNKSLSSPGHLMTRYQQDALWAAAALLGSVSFAHIDEATDPCDVWPMKQEDDPTDLNWIRLGFGKQTILRLSRIDQPDSIYAPFVEASKFHAFTWPTIVPWEVMPPFFCSVFGISELVPRESNPYYAQASKVAIIYDEVMVMNDSNAHKVMGFVNYGDARYRELVERKDPRALLLLLFWYSKVIEAPSWWVRKRAILEGPAISMYLERECVEDTRIMSLLEYPKEAFRKFQNISPGDKLFS